MGKARARALGAKTRKAGGKPFVKGDPRIKPRWKKGESGNPSGMPKDRAAAQAHLERRLREEFLDQSIDLLMLRAKLDPSATALIEAINRMAGKVPDKTELTGKDGDAIALRIEKRKARVQRFETMLQRMKAKDKPPEGA